MKVYPILAACAATALLSACASTNIENIAVEAANSSVEATTAKLDKAAIIAKPILETVVAEETLVADVKIDPAPVSENLLYTAMTKWEMMSFVEAARTAKLTDILEGEQAVTLFAPTNDAFERAGSVDADMATLLKNHMIEGALSSEDLAALIPEGASSTKIDTLGGQSLTLYKVGGALRVAGADGLLAKIVTADTDASNGVLHQINSVLLSE